MAGAPALARDSLGIFDGWGAFRDPDTPRCYAIAQPASRDPRAPDAFASVGDWPRKRLRNQLYFRLARDVASNRSARLLIGGRRFELTAAGHDAWAANPTDNAAIIAAMRSARTMTVSARGVDGHRFSSRYALAGAATAMDAATLGCARLR